MRPIKGCYVFYLPRGMKKDELADLYSGIEIFKNGVAYDKRNHATKTIITIITIKMIIIIVVPTLKILFDSNPALAGASQDNLVHIHVCM